jgi:hypothetical protein
MELFFAFATSPTSLDQMVALRRRCDLDVSYKDVHANAYVNGGRADESALGRNGVAIGKGGEFVTVLQIELKRTGE